MNSKDKKAEQKIKTILNLLKAKDQGIKEIKINFSGSGDSGDIDDVEFYTFNGGYITPKEVDTDTFINLAWGLIAEKVDPVGDWVNNEGGYGNITIYAETGKYDIEYSQRTTEDYDWGDCSLFI